MKNNIIRLVTNNTEKIAIANYALEGSGIDLKVIELSCPEIQSSNAEDIAIFSAKYAFDVVKQPIVKIDTGLYIEALNGFPGPYTSYVEEKIDASDILKLMEGKTNRRVYYKDVMAYYDGCDEPVIFEAYTFGTICDTLSGNYGWNFDQFFIIDGEQLTNANFKKNERVKKYNCDHWIKLKNYLVGKNIINY